MLSAESVLARLERQAVVPVLRTRDAADAVETARACLRAGMQVIELTYSIPDVEQAVRELAAADCTVVGVGTVTEPRQVRSSVERGAQFVVSYGFDPGVIAAAVELGVAVIPGALTPSEVDACRRAGATAVKLFPARLIQPAYLRDLRAVMPELKLVVTGGIAATVEGVRPWLEAGAAAVGIGSALGSAGADGANEVERRARELVGLRIRNTNWSSEGRR